MKINKIHLIAGLWIFAGLNLLKASDKPTAHVSYYAESSRVKQTVPLDSNGLPHGLLRRYSEDGKLIAVMTYVHGKLDGVLMQFNEAGDVKFIRIYTSEELLEKTFHFNSEGRFAE